MTALPDPDRTLRVSKLLNMGCHLCRLSYKGLGEPICVVAFGPLSVGAFYIAQVIANISHPAL